MDFDTAINMVRSPGYKFPSATAALALAALVVRRIKSKKNSVADYSDVLKAAEVYLRRAKEPGTQRVADDILNMLKTEKAGGKDVVAQKLNKRLAEVVDRMNEMNETLVGCDWCCGGGEEEMDALRQEKEEIEQKLKILERS